MPMDVLEECIRELVAEAVARKEAEPKRLADLYAGRKDVPMQRPKFKLNEFKALGSVDEMLTYANKTLQDLGEGSARKVFRFSGTKVLKIARNDKQGVGQNEAEFQIAANADTSSVVARIFDHDASFKWIICEVVKPFNSRNAFETATGIPWKLFRESIESERVQYVSELSDEQYTFVESVLLMIESNGLLPGDVATYEHWGMTASGRVAILDYGYTSRVDKDHYGSDNLDV